MGKQWKQWQTFWAPKSQQMMTAATKLRHLLLGRKVMTKLDSILQSRDITLPTKVSLVKAMVYPVVMYGCESWTIKKAECWRIDAFELWCWRRLLRVPWMARKSNQSIQEVDSATALEADVLYQGVSRAVVSLEALRRWIHPASSMAASHGSFMF